MGFSSFWLVFRIVSDAAARNLRNTPERDRKPCWRRQSSESSTFFDDILLRVYFLRSKFDLADCCCSWEGFDAFWIFQIFFEFLSSQHSHVRFGFLKVYDLFCVSLECGHVETTRLWFGRRSEEMASLQRDDGRDWGIRDVESDFKSTVQWVLSTSSFGFTSSEFQLRHDDMMASHFQNSQTYRRTSFVHSSYLTFSSISFLRTCLS